MSEKEISTLFGLLKEYKVEIPIVQRDYAQGRQDDHAKNVRLNLLKDMNAAILGGAPLDLSFVYGKVENQKFIPIDGQQRLTTLFLLYLYVFRNDDSKTSILNKFTYETRVTSREFLKKLIENRIHIFDKNIKPSDEIEDSEWFVSSWIHDPTIKSVLIMLDDIKSIFNAVDDLSVRLTDEINEPITFKFLEMQDLGMEDSLYIKLNARGKPLTDFENLKAQLIGRMKILKLPYINAFEQNFDCEWTDLFWNKYKKDFDQMYHAFFGVLLMNCGIIQEEKGWANVLDYSKIDADIFDAAFYTLNFLCQNSAENEINSLIFRALSEGRTYQNRISFHAVVSYLLKSKGVDNGSLKYWMRIINNLTLNSDIDRIDRYRNAIDGINSFTEYWNDLTLFFANKNKVTGFNQQQVLEEQIKAGIMQTDKSFADKIELAEQHSYFSGQIRSALYLSKNKDGFYDEKQFDYYWTKISKLFNATKPKYGNLLRRALLTFGDYTLSVSQFQTLCVDIPNESAKTPSLKSLFSNCDTITTQFLNAIDVNYDIEAQLNQIIKNSNVSKNDWRYCFIQYPKLFTLMSVSHLRLRVLNGEMHIIQNIGANGYNYTLFLAALYEELCTHGIETKFDEMLGTLVQHCLYAKEHIITFEKKKFYIENQKGENVFVSQSADPIRETADFIYNNL